MNEVKNPIRTLKSVSTAALLTACIMYLLVNIAYFIVVPLDEIKDSRELIAALFFEKCFGPSVGKTLLPLAVALSGAGNVMVVTFALVRRGSENEKRLADLIGAIESGNSTTRVPPVLQPSRIV
jgi:amino acid transporter